MPVTTDFKVFANNYHQFRHDTMHGTQHYTNNWLTELQHVDYDTWTYFFENYIQPIIHQRANAKALKALKIPDEHNIMRVIHHRDGTTTKKQEKSGFCGARFFLQYSYPKLNGGIGRSLIRIDRLRGGDYINSDRLSIQNLFPSEPIFIRDGFWRDKKAARCSPVVIEGTKEQLKQFLEDKSIHYRKSWSKPKLRKAIYDHYINM